MTKKQRKRYGRRGKGLMAATVCAALALALSALLCACGPSTASSAGSAGPPAADAPGQNEAPFTVVCSGFSQYDWVRNLITGCEDRWNVIRLNEKGADVHSYQPSARDMADVCRCDLIVYTGGVSEEWIEDAMEEEGRFSGRAYCLLENGELRKELDPAFTGHEDSHGHEEASGDGGAAGGGAAHLAEADEHIWLSPANAMKFCGDIAEQLAAIDPDNAKSYRENASAYMERLGELDSRYSTALSGAPNRVLIFADRFPFRYLAGDYSLTCFAAFSGCSADAEVDFDTVIFLADRINQYDAHALFITERSGMEMAQAAMRAAGRENMDVYALNSLQSVRKSDVKDGLTYIGAMESNLKIIEKALKA